ncbi:MAG: carbohydrate binding family 9 domain-containing protein, partial [Gemmatimonadota bacterium]
MIAKILLLLIFIGGVLIFPGQGTFAQTEGSADSMTSRGENVVASPPVDVEIWVPKLQGWIHVDGRLGDEGWVQAARLETFFETEPGDNVEPSVETKVWMTYDDHTLYIGFHCYDDPTTIRATLSDRDQFRADDIIFIILDTFQNYQTGYQLGVNPYGLQVDILRNMEEQDGTFDIVWHSAGRIVDDGWVAEMAIPFKSLRFPNREEQEWGFHCIRLRPRESLEEISWPSRDRDNPCFLCQAAVLKGIRGVNAGRNMEILPYALSFQAGSLEDSDDPESPFQNEDVDGAIGFNFKYGLTSDLTLDFAYNPDFSQVESDVAQIDINTPFALFYPEKRPFFLEGNDIFSSQIHAVYTRTINDPILAAKLTGRVNETSIGYILAKDERSPFIVPFQEQSDFVPSSVTSVSNVFRLKHDVWEDSFLGAMVTNREVGSGYNRVAGVDASIRFFSDYRITVQALQSWTQEPPDTSLYENGDTLRFDEGRYSAKFDGEEFQGLGLS